MKAVVMDMGFAVMAQTREEAISIMDEIGNRMLDVVGGAPWLAISDDITKTEDPGKSVSDDQGFLYQGRRRYSFQGPYLGGLSQTQHEGFRVQSRVGEDDA